MKCQWESTLLRVTTLLHYPSLTENQQLWRGSKLKLHYTMFIRPQVLCFFDGKYICQHTNQTLFNPAHPATLILFICYYHILFINKQLLSCNFFEQFSRKVIPLIRHIVKYFIFPVKAKDKQLPLILVANLCLSKTGAYFVFFQSTRLHYLCNATFLVCNSTLSLTSP